MILIKVIQSKIHLSIFFYDSWYLEKNCFDVFISARQPVYLHQKDVSKVILISMHKCNRYRNWYIWITRQKHLSTSVFEHLRRYCIRQYCPFLNATKKVWPSWTVNMDKRELLHNFRVSNWNPISTILFKVLLLNYPDHRYKSDRMI